MGAGLPNRRSSRELQIFRTIGPDAQDRWIEFWLDVKRQINNWASVVTNTGAVKKDNMTHTKMKIQIMEMAIEFSHNKELRMAIEIMSKYCG